MASKKSDSKDTLRYLVAWGGDKRSQDALKLGEILARTFNAKLDVVYVVIHASDSATLSASDLTYAQEIGRDARGWLKKAVKSIGKDVDVETHVAYSSSITHGILETAKRLNASTIVIGAGSGAGQPVATNAIVGGLLHASPVPIAMAPRGYRKVKFDSLTMLSAAIGPRPGADQVGMQAADVVSRVGLPLQLISLAALKDDKNVGLRNYEAADRALEEARRRIGRRAEVTTVIGRGRSLKQAVKSLKWDERTAVLVGSSRLGQKRRTFLGSSATRMLSSLPVPMIVVPRKDDK